MAAILTFYPRRGLLEATASGQAFRVPVYRDHTRILAWEGEVEGLRFTHVGEQAFKMFGYPASVWCEPNFLASHIHPADQERVITAHLNEIEVKEHFDLTFRMLGADGQVVWVQNLVSVTKATDRFFAPAIGITPGQVMINVGPCITSVAVIFSYGSPLAFTQVRPPLR